MRVPTAIVVLVQGATALIAVAALILSVTTVNDRVSSIQQSRLKAGYASCQLIQHLVGVATPTGRKAQAEAFLKRAGLSDCAAYAKKVVIR